MKLFHYTDEYGAKSIRDTLVLRPYPQPLLGGRRAVWFTDIPILAPRTVKARRSIGVDHDKYEHDRTGYCFQVEIQTAHDPVFLWSSVAFEYPGAYAVSDAPLGARPDAWWLSFVDIIVTNLNEVTEA